MKIELVQKRRTVLMLQGPASRFWSRLAEEFSARGYHVIHVCLSLGDRLYWRGPRSVDLRSYRGTPADWEAWLEALVTTEGVDDIVYYGDRLPYHIAAQSIAARRFGLRCWAVELGYLRPDWMTLEPFALGRNSRFTRDPDTIRALAQGVEPPDTTLRYSHRFWTEAMNEVLFHTAPVFGRPFYPHFDNDRKNAAILDYLSWLKRIVTARRVRKQAKRAQRFHLRTDAPFALIALQLDADYQIRGSSDYTSQTEMLEEVVSSFARHAPARMRLLLKLHPHDSGLIDWWGFMDERAARHGVTGRVTTIRGGNFAALSAASHGVITTNSTAGVTALGLGRPVKVMGDAVYDLPGMTHQGGLDRFWTAPEEPDQTLVDAWHRAVSAEIQLRGSFFDPKGQRDGAAEIARRIADHQRYWQLYSDRDTTRQPMHAMG